MTATACLSPVDYETFKAALPGARFRRYGVLYAYFYDYVVVCSTWYGKPKAKLYPLTTCGGWSSLAAVGQGDTPAEAVSEMYHNRAAGTTADVPDLLFGVP